MGPMVTTPTPDGNLNYNDLIGSTLKVPYFPQNILAYFYICDLETYSFCLTELLRSRTVYYVV